MKNHRISIVTPSLNQGKFIEETINSVINQEGNFELEYIIMDGGSNDNTLEIIRRYDLLIKNKKINIKCKKLIFKWFSEKDTGQSNAINKGFKISTGEIINWLCSDDLLEIGALQKIIDFFNENKDAKVVFGDSIIIDENRENTGIQKGREFTREELIRRFDRVYIKFSIPQPSTFLKKEITEEIGLLNEKTHLAMDYEWYLNINKKYKFYYINYLLSYSRFHKDAKTVKLDEESYKKSIEISKKYFSELDFRVILLYYLINPRILLGIKLKRYSPKIYNFLNKIKKCFKSNLNLITIKIQQISRRNI